MTRELRVTALLGAIEDHRRTRCDELLSQARGEAQKLLREAHVAARAKLRASLDEERSRLERQVANGQARLQTERRLAAQRELAALLREASRQLQAALVDAWRAPLSRERWASYHLGVAAGLLATEGWRVRHAAGLAEGERARLAAALEARGVHSVEWSEDAAIAAGLQVRAQANMLDATLEGLFADARALESQLLVLLEGAAR